MWLWEGRHRRRQSWEKGGELLWDALLCFALSTESGPEGLALVVSKWLLSIKGWGLEGWKALAGGVSNRRVAGSGWVQLGHEAARCPTPAPHNNNPHAQTTRCAPSHKPHLDQLGHEAARVQLLRCAHRLIQAGADQVIGEQRLAQRLALLGRQVLARRPASVGILKEMDWIPWIDGSDPGIDSRDAGRPASISLRIY
jgi:hypothetical protein